MILLYHGSNLKINKIVYQDVDLIKTLDKDSIVQL